MWWKKKMLVTVQFYNSAHKRKMKNHKECHELICQRMISSIITNSRCAESTLCFNEDIMNTNINWSKKRSCVVWDDTLTQFPFHYENGKIDASIQELLLALCFILVSVTELMLNVFSFFSYKKRTQLIKVLTRHNETIMYTNHHSIDLRQIVEKKNRWICV